VRTDRNHDRAFQFRNTGRSPFQNRGLGSSYLVAGEGTIRFISLEGDGFYGIITDSGDQFIPDNLPVTLSVEGTHVTFRGLARTPSPNVRMWGTPLSLISIDKDNHEVSANGTIIRLDLEGGFYGIVTTSGENYLPLNLPDEFEVDGLAVSFNAHEDRETATIAMWGIPIQLDSIALANQAQGQITGSWYLVQYLERGSLCPLLPGTLISAEFDGNGQVSGTAGCNHYFASCEVKGPSLEVGTIGSTKMYCSSPKGSMQQESAYLNLLGKATAFSIRSENLVLIDATGNEILFYSKAVPEREKDPGILVEYTRTGGFAGFDDNMVIYTDGSASVNRKESARMIMVDDTVLEELEGLLKSANFNSLEENYPADQEGADFFTYHLTCGGKTVVMEDSAIPAAIVPIIDILNEIIGNSAPDDVIPPLPDF
jgi:heat shock protein HslJ